MSALLTKIIMLMHTKTKFCDVVEPNGRNPSSSYAALACNLVWPELYVRIVSRRTPWACGTSSHKLHPRTLVSDWLVHRARGEREARPEVERSLKSAGLTSFTNTSTTGGQGSQETGSLLSSAYLASIADFCQKSQGHTSFTPSQPNDSSQACQVALNKQKLVAGRGMLTRDMDANEKEQ